MSASQEQKVDYLLKKIGYVSSKTGIAEDSSLSGTKKAPFAEPISSPLVVPSSFVWSDSSFIPTTPPGSTGTYVEVYATASAYQMTVDTTVSGNRTFIARATAGDSSSAIEGDWIDPSFGANYVIKVYKGDPNSGGALLPAAGSGSNDTWFFDYSSGVLNFNGTSVPSGVTSTNIYLVGYRYIGAKGIKPPAGIATFNDLNVSGITTLGTVQISSGIVTATSGVVTYYGDGSNLTSIPNSALTNSSVSYGGVSLSLGGSDATPAFNLSDATSYPYTSLTGVSTDIVGDTSPQLGGNLDANSKDITGVNNLNVSGVSTFTGDVSFGSTATFGDDDKLKFGDGVELEIYSNGSSSFIKERGSGNLKVLGNSILIKDTTDSEFYAKFNQGGSVDLYHNNGKRFETTGIGVSIVGTGNTATITGPSNLVLDPGTVGDNTGTVTILGNLQVDGTQTVINSTTMTVDDLNITLASGAANAAAADGAGLTVDGASATLTYASSGDKWVFNKVPYYNTNRILTTADEGSGNGIDADTLDSIDSGSFLRSDVGDTKTSGDLTFNDNVKINLGSSGQLDSSIYHSGTDATFVSRNGDIVLQTIDTGEGGSGDDIIIKAGTGKTSIFAHNNGAVELWNDGSKKFETTGVGVTVTGDLIVSNNARITGILTVGSSSITLDGSDNSIHGFDTLIAPPKRADTVNISVTVGSKTTANRYYDQGAGNSYFLNGVEAPFLTLTPGRTYRFTLSSSDMTNHPFRLYLEADKTTAYTTNVTSTATYTEIVVNDATPSVLHYQCSAHSLMGNSVQTNSSVSVGSGANLTSIPNSALTNSSVSYGGVSLALGASDATPAFDLSDATNYPTSSLSGTITNAQLAGSIANNKLSNSSVSYGGISLSLGASDATPAFDLSDATNYPYAALTGVSTDIVGDTTPQLGGNLDLNSKDITGTGNLNVTGVVTATTFSGSGASLTSIPNGALTNSSVSYGGVSLSLGGSDATPAFDLSDATNYPYTSLTGVTTNIIGDTTPQLGGNLDLNSNNINGTGDIDVTGYLSVTSTDAGNGSGPYIDLYRNSASPAASDNLGMVRFWGENDADEKKSYSYIISKILDPTDGSEDGRMDFVVMGDGSASTRMVLQGTGATKFVNQDILLGQSVDLIFEGASSNTNETTLTVTDPTQDNTITFPDATGTVLLTDGSAASLTGLTGASAATYGNSTTTPVITVDANGRITTISTATISGGGGGGGVGYFTTTTSGVNYTGIGTASAVGIGTIIEIIPYDTQNSGTLSFEASAGQLFSITNNLSSGSIFSVNDISGIPSIDVDADGTVLVAPYSTTEKVGIGTTNPSYKMDVVGDINFTGTLYQNGSVFSSGSGGGISNVVEDTTPELGGNLDLNSKNITGIGTIDVTGDLLLTSTDAGSGAGPFIDLYRNSASPSNNDTLGKIRFYGENDNDEKILYSSIYAYAADETDGTEDARLYLDVISAGSDSNRIMLQGGGNTKFMNKNVTLDTGVDLVFEGASSNSNETTLTVVDPTQDNTITFPDATGTVLLNVVEDTTPQLGGNLDLNSKDITGTGNLNVSGVVTATTFSGSGASLTSIPNSALTNSSVSYGGISLSLGASDATPAFDLSDATNYPYTSLTGISTDIVGDTTPQLGGDLDLNSKNITGIGTVDVTGTISVTSTDATNSAGPFIDLYRNSASPAGYDKIGRVRFYGENDNDEKISYADIRGLIADPTDGSEDGRLDFVVTTAGSASTRITMQGAGKTLFSNQDILLGSSVNLVFEGATANSNETTLTVTDPTQDNTITLPDATGTVLLTDGSAASLTGLTGASAATYGSATATPVIVVDANGRITGISTVATSGGGGGGGSSTTRSVNRYVATNNQTLFPPSGTVSYAVGYIDVYLNGSKLDTTEFTASNGTTVTLTTGASTNDIVELVAYTSINVTNVTVVNDTSPQLGGDLDLNGNDITGTGNINVTGTATVTGGQVATQNDAIAFAIALG